MYLCYMWGDAKCGRIAGFVVILLMQMGCGTINMDTSAHDLEVVTLRKAYAAFNRNDIPAAVESVDPQVEWIEPAEFPGGGAYHGREAVKGYLTQSRANWTEGSSEPERFIVAGDKIVVFVHARARLKGSDQWQDTRLADVFTFHNGKIVHMHAFADRRQALEWAGVKSVVSP